MPNLVDCELTVKGKAKRLSDFRQKMTGNDCHGIPTLLNEEVLIPYPEEYKELDKIAQEYEGRWYAVLDSLKDSEGKTDDEEREQVYKKFVEENGAMPKDGFNSGGYEWCIASWGTKWGFCSVKLARETTRSLLYSFGTAWSPPTPLIEKMSELFPDLEFKLKYWEGGMGFQGCLRLLDSKILEDECRDYSGYRGG